MRRALTILATLATILIAALVLLVRRGRAAEHGPASGSGVVEGVDVDVASRFAARIVAVRAAEGARVSKGDLLVELDCVEQVAALAQAKARLAGFEASVQAAQATAASSRGSSLAAIRGIDASRSQLASLRAQEDLAKRELERTESLVRAGALPNSALDETKARYETLRAQVAAQVSSEDIARAQADAMTKSGKAADAQAGAAAANIEGAKAEIARLEASAAECKLFAPRDGIIASRNYEPGEVVQPGAPILTLTDVSDARCRFYLPNGALAWAASGRAVRATADAYPGQSFSGVILSVSPRAEFTPRNVQTRNDRERLVYAVVIQLPNPELKLRPGMPLDVDIDGSWQ